jgi:hypothetical protein
MSSWSRAADLLVPASCRDCGRRHFSTARDWEMVGPHELDVLIAEASKDPDAWPTCRCLCCPAEALTEAIEALERKQADA